MTTGIGKWMVPVAGFVLGLLIAAALLATQGPLQAAIAFVIVAGYGMVVWVLQSRSDVASLLMGQPRDERWESINLRALSLAGQVMAVALLAAFLVTQFGGSDATPYAWLGALLAVTYLGGILWYRQRS